MKQFIHINYLTCLILLCFIFETAHAITVTVPGSTCHYADVSVSITSTFAGAGSCPIQVDFGDGSPLVDAGTCTTTPCTLTVSHYYSYHLGFHTITAMSNSCSEPPVGPDPASTSIQLICCCSFDILGSFYGATQGAFYSVQLSHSGGVDPVTYQLISGSLPAGVSLSSSGLISGVPSVAGNYNFTVQGTDSRLGTPQTDTETFGLTVAASEVATVISAVPLSLSVAHGIPANKQVAYHATITPGISAQLMSSQGQFFVGDQAIGFVNTPLTLSVMNGFGTVRESLFIPVSVLKRASNLKSNQLMFRRTFTGEATSATVTLPVMITTSAGADFNIAGIRLFFDNRSTRASVKRNEPLPKLFAEISFTGSGLLQGYWEVDEKFFQTETKHLSFGKPVFLAAPSTPSFPTHEPGSHRVRFVITSPENDTIFPEVIYSVSENVRSKPGKIQLVLPENESVVFQEPSLFSWKGRSDSEVYRIEFLNAQNMKSVFSAFTKNKEYTLLSGILKKRFKPEKTYQWSVTELSPGGREITKSKPYTFHLSQFASHIPGRILITMQNDLAFIEKIRYLAQKKQFKLFDEFALVSVNRYIMIYDVKTDLAQTIKELQKIPMILNVQPEYLFRSMSDPMDDMHTLSKTLKFDQVHKNCTGKGVTVAVIDTGVDTSHDDLKNNVTVYENLIRGSQYKGEIHGTAVAGIIAAEINGSGIGGIAPEATILALRGCQQRSKESPDGDCYTSSILKALDIAVAKKADIINMSFGSVVYDRLIAELLDKGALQNCIFVAPVGNQKKMKTIGFPASHPSVIAVSGTDDRGKPYPNSRLCKKSDLSAPAENVFTTIPGNSHNFMNGTSFSSAIVSGILALATEKKKSLNIKELPRYDGSIGDWEMSVLNLSGCGDE